MKPEHTPLLDYESQPLQDLIQQRHWNDLPSVYDQIAAVHAFVKDEILYGFPSEFQRPASKVLQQGIGSNLDKTILLMALFRALGIPCRMHASIIDKVIHRGLLGWLSFKLCPSGLFHGAVELLYQNKSIELEGYSVDQAYLSKLQAMFPDYCGSFYGYGIAVLNFRNPPTRWEGFSTSIQDKAVIEELGPFDDPDSFFTAYPEAQKRTQNTSYKKLIRPRLNKAIAGIRR